MFGVGGFENAFAFANVKMSMQQGKAKPVQGMMTFEDFPNFIKNDIIGFVDRENIFYVGKIIP